MQNVNVSTKMVKMGRRRELPCVRHSRSLYSRRVIYGALVMSMERKKSDEEAKKKQ
jgi:hypothetical protein